METWVVPAEGADTLAEPTLSFHESFVRLFRAHHQRLYRYLQRLSGDPDLAADLAQETFIRLYRRGALPDSPEAWLISVAMNLFRNRYRRALLATRRGVGITRQEDAFEVVDDRHVAIQALSSLAPRQRAAIVLTEVLRYTAEEAGSMLGIRAATVRALHFQARSALKNSGRTNDA